MKFRHIVLISLSFALITSCSNENTLNIATSANMQFAMSEIVSEFKKDNDIKVELIITSSGKLTSQIEQGAPFDIFVAANTKYPAYLDSLGLTTSAPKVYAHGKLGLWTLKEFSPTLTLLTTDTIQKIAIANPKTAPYGKASIDVLKHYGIYERVKHKLVFGESISQVNQFITTGSADIGFTAYSIVSCTEMKTIGKWTSINLNDHGEILQAAVIIKESTNPDEAKAFYNFIFSERASEILNKYGYLSPEE
jgi:molybdate transport system substrate-binding protein